MLFGALRSTTQTAVVVQTGSPALRMRKPDEKSKSFLTYLLLLQGQMRQLSEILSQNKKCKQGWGYRSAVESWPDMCKALGSTPSPRKRKILCFLFIKSHHLRSSRKGGHLDPRSIERHSQKPEASDTSPKDHGAGAGALEGKEGFPRCSCSQLLCVFISGGGVFCLFVC